MTDTILEATKQEPTLQLTLAVCSLAGIVLAMATFGPDRVGRLLTSTGLLLVAMTFIGSGLSYVALIPENAQLQIDLEGRGESQ